jgi:hypothetical protein
MGDGQDRCTAEGPPAIPHEAREYAAKDQRPRAVAHRLLNGSP